MADNRMPPEVWSEHDRPCGQCGVRAARSDDWLCQRCRDGLEAEWERLAHPHDTLPAARQPTVKRIPASFA